MSKLLQSARQYIGVISVAGPALLSREDSLSALNFLQAGTSLLLAAVGTPGFRMCWAKNFCQPPGLPVKPELQVRPQIADPGLNHFCSSEAYPTYPPHSTARGVCSQVGKDHTSKTPNAGRCGATTRPAGGQGSTLIHGGRKNLPTVEQ